MEEMGPSALWHGVDQSSNVTSKGNELNFAELRCSTHGVTCYSGAVLQPRLAELELLKSEVHNEKHLIAHRCRNTVITGGLGSISLICAALISVGSKSNIYLLSRKGRSRNPYPSFLVLKNGIGKTISASVDICSSEDFAFMNLFTSRNVTAVVHAAGTLRDATILHQTVGYALKVSAPKLAVGSRFYSSLGFLSEYSNIPLSLILAFTSVASLIGSYGQAPYAAANAQLESHVALERSKGVVLSAIAWGAWKSVGMAAGRPARVAEKFGLGALTPILGTHALLKVLSHTTERQVVTPFDWMILSRSMSSRNMNISAFSEIIASRRIVGKVESLGENPVIHTNDATVNDLARDASDFENTRHFTMLTLEQDVESSIMKRLITLVHESLGSTVDDEVPKSLACEHKSLRTDYTFLFHRIPAWISWTSKLCSCKRIARRDS